MAELHTDTITMHVVTMLPVDVVAWISGTKGTKPLGSNLM